VLVFEKLEAEVDIKLGVGVKVDIVIKLIVV